MLSGTPSSSLRPPLRGSGGSVLGVIPARLASARLPRKPLISIAGRPLIEWVWRRMSELQVVDELVVAADSEEIIGVVQGFGGRAVATRADHASGTDRVAEVAERQEYARFACIVNLQGDEPFLPAAAVEGAVGFVAAGWHVGTAAARLSSRAEWHDPSVVKAVVGDEGRALYFSRAPVPHAAGGGDDAAELEAGPLWLRHLGVYAFSRPALQRATQLPRHPLEERERLEQLRWLAAGMRIGVAIVDGGGPGIDTEADLVRAEALLGKREDST